MPKLTEAELLARDAGRDLNAELLEAAADMQAGRVGRATLVTRRGQAVESPVARVRIMARLSQARFAALLGVSPRTLQDWEQAAASRPVPPRPCCVSPSGIRRCCGNWLRREARTQQPKQGLHALLLSLPVH